MGKPIYVEIPIRAPLEELWRLTQTPDLHQRWDLRFTRIAYLPRPDPAGPQRFLYETRIGFGLAVAGEGETVGERDLVDGTRSSALRFWSEDPKSLIREGSGYWKYVPDGGAIRFLTRYDYAPRFGPPGRWLDALLFRPLLGWATAWSFDRLRRWLEDGLRPEAALRQALVHAVARAALGLIWIYQGLVPKLLAPERGELAILGATAGVGGAIALPLGGLRLWVPIGLVSVGSLLAAYAASHLAGAGALSLPLGYAIGNVATLGFTGIWMARRGVRLGPSQAVVTLAALVALALLAWQVAR